MKQIVIDTGNITGLTAYALFEKEGLQPGDTVRILKWPKLSQEAWVALVVMVMIAADYFLKKKVEKAPLAEALMNELSSTEQGVAELRSDLKKEFDVRVEMEPSIDADRDFWRELGLKAMARGYSVDEPDISHITLLEPNPDYKPWKKGM